MLLLLTSALAQIDWPIAQQVSAVDATALRESAIDTFVPGTLSYGLYKVCEHRGIHIRMDWTPLQSSLAALRLTDPGPI